MIRRGARCYAYSPSCPSAFPCHHCHSQAWSAQSVALLDGQDPAPRHWGTWELWALLWGAGAGGEELGRAHVKGWAVATAARDAAAVNIHAVVPRGRSCLLSPHSIPSGSGGFSKISRMLGTATGYWQRACSTAAASEPSAAPFCRVVASLQPREVLGMPPPHRTGTCPGPPSQFFWGWVGMLSRVRQGTGRIWWPLCLLRSVCCTVAKADHSRTSQALADFPCAPPNPRHPSSWAALHPHRC